MPPASSSSTALSSTSTPPLMSHSLRVPCVIGRRSPWQWHRPGFGEKLSPLLVLWGSFGKLSWDLSRPAGWHGALCLSEKSPERKHTLHG
ncbi:hypothetical protein INR49_020239 [Caranx melampygus]|nr:hypothetical protein INR49_020239 [Caranx melampygus]